MYDKILVKNDKNIDIGYLFFRRGRGIEWQEFQYSDSWICCGRRIDPEIPLCEGIHRASLSEFGCFSDAAPDSWGRALIKQYFKKTQNKNSLFPSEYLLSVDDKFRIGDFRFYDEEGNIVPSHNFAVPAIKDLRTFQNIINKYQKGEEIFDADFLNIINYGSSLGGARPKLSIVNTDNSLWLAKFSSIHDTYDNPAREAISLLIAKKCNINVPDFTLFQISDTQSILLVKRFDREGDQRIPFLSAKTFLQAEDGKSNEYSYLDIAGIIESESYGTAKKDLKELYKRLLLNVLIGNKDDHLRNHGFLYRDNGWQLSPVFDLEISPDKAFHSLALDDEGSLSCSLEKILEMAEYYGLSYTEAKEIVGNISDIVCDWEKIAQELHIPETSIRKMPKYTILS